MAKNYFFKSWDSHLLFKLIELRCSNLLSITFRYYVSGLMKGGADMFVENMPGLPDNIRLSSSGGYWVAMAAVRPNPGFSLLDFLSEKPWIKRMIFKVKKKI